MAKKWLEESLEQARREAEQIPLWKREISVAIDEYYGRNAPSKHRQPETGGVPKKAGLHTEPGAEFETADS